jgi:hypothetical protein
MEAKNAIETSVNFYQATRRKIPEEKHLRTLSCENLTSHWVCLFLYNIQDWPKYIPGSQWKHEKSWTDNTYIYHNFMEACYVQSNPTYRIQNIYWSLLHF